MNQTFPQICTTTIGGHAIPKAVATTLADLHLPTCQDSPPSNIPRVVAAMVATGELPPVLVCQPGYERAPDEHVMGPGTIVSFLDGSAAEYIDEYAPMAGRTAAESRAKYPRWEVQRPIRPPEQPEAKPWWPVGFELAPEDHIIAAGDLRGEVFGDGEGRLLYAFTGVEGNTGKPVGRLTAGVVGLQVARPIKQQAEQPEPHAKEKAQWNALTPTAEPGVRVDAETGQQVRVESSINNGKTWSKVNDKCSPRWMKDRIYRLQTEPQSEANARIVREYEEKPEGRQLICENLSMSEPGNPYRFEYNTKRHTQTGAHLRFRIIDQPASGSAEEAKYNPVVCPECGQAVGPVNGEIGHHLYKGTDCLGCGFGPVPMIPATPPAPKAEAADVRAEWEAMNFLTKSFNYTGK